MAEPRKTITPSYMKGTSSGSRADKILRERAARERDAVREQDRLRQLAATIEQEEIGSQYYSSEQQGRLRANPLSRFSTTEAIKKEAERVKGVLDREQAASDREQAAREERAKNPYAINTDIQQEESRNQGIGTDLLQQFLDKAYDMPILLISDEGEENAFGLTNWYEKYGFEYIGESGGYPVLLKRVEK